MNRLISAFLFLWLSWYVWDSSSWEFSSSSKKEELNLQREILQQKLPDLSNDSLSAEVPWKNVFLGGGAVKRKYTKKSTTVWESPLEGSRLKGVIPGKRASVLYNGKTESITVGQELASCSLLQVQSTKATFKCGSHKVDVGWK